VEIELVVGITERSAAKVAKDFLSAAFASNWATSVEEAKVVKLPNTTEIVVSIVDFRSAWRWA